MSSSRTCSRFVSLLTVGALVVVPTIGLAGPASPGTILDAILGAIVDVREQVAELAERVVALEERSEPTVIVWSQNEAPVTDIADTPDVWRLLEVGDARCDAMALSWRFKANAAAHDQIHFRVWVGPDPHSIGLIADDDLAWLARFDNDPDIGAVHHQGTALIANAGNDVWVQLFDVESATFSDARVYQSACWTH